MQVSTICYIEKLFGEKTSSLAWEQDALRKRAAEIADEEYEEAKSSMTI